jgi:hypothetical protein
MYVPMYMTVLPIYWSLGELTGASNQRKVGHATRGALALNQALAWLAPGRAAHGHSPACTHLQFAAQNHSNEQPGHAHISDHVPVPPGRCCHQQPPCHALLGAPLHPWQRQYQHASPAGPCLPASAHHKTGVQLCAQITCGRLRSNGVCPETPAVAHARARTKSHSHTLQMRSAR